MQRLLLWCALYTTLLSFGLEGAWGLAIPEDKPISEWSKYELGEWIESLDLGLDKNEFDRQNIGGSVAHYIINTAGYSGDEKEVEIIQALGLDDEEVRQQLKSAFSAKSVELQNREFREKLRQRMADSEKKKKAEAPKPPKPEDMPSPDKISRWTARQLKEFIRLYEVNPDSMTEKKELVAKALELRKGTLEEAGLAGAEGAPAEAAPEPAPVKQPKPPAEVETAEEECEEGQPGCEVVYEECQVGEEGCEEYEEHDEL
uniref:Uncharacterized protein n=1 Tax=Eutreptiella gymnastica TaxID=73025 RepID=A0A7S1IEX5_9EUGL|mmetsp:Transcript_152539/g.266321  ORF Transcript_152539/g.266321 Transcript_152539/m.266321 type:complete len:259 (+) Transcript_152539:25-801(+)